MRNDVDSIQVDAACQCFGDLGDAVARILQQDDFNFPRWISVTPQVIQQLLIIVNAGVEKDEFVTNSLSRVNGYAGTCLDAAMSFPSHCPERRWLLFQQVRNQRRLLQPSLERQP